MFSFHISPPLRECLCFFYATDQRTAGTVSGSPPFNLNAPKGVITPGWGKACKCRIKLSFDLRWTGKVPTKGPGPCFDSHPPTGNPQGLNYSRVFKLSRRIYLAKIFVKGNFSLGLRVINRGGWSFFPRRRNEEGIPTAEKLKEFGL